MIDVIEHNVNQAVDFTVSAKEQTGKAEAGQYGHADRQHPGRFEEQEESASLGNKRQGVEGGCHQWPRTCLHF